MACSTSINLTIKFLLISFFISYVFAACTPDKAEPDFISEVTAINRINSLLGLTWHLDSYLVGICTVGLVKSKTAGVLLESPKGNIVLGRTNHTHALSGDDWVILIYRGGDTSNLPLNCTGNYSSEIIIVCDRSQPIKGKMRLVEHDGCVIRFELKSLALCPPESPSAWALAFVWAVFLFTLYCLVGIIYRRYKLRVQGRQQLPNLAFWSKIGSGCADCCNWACRCEEEPVATWDAETDRDEVLLRP